MPTSALCLGSHLSIAGGVFHAVEDARRLRFDTVQIFVKNQRQWRAAPFRDGEVERWRELAAADGFGPAVAHATYLINLATDDEELGEKSRRAFAEELARCDALGVPYLVVHPGSARAQPVEQAIRNVARRLDQILAAAPQGRCQPLLETTAGQGRTLGRSFTELGAIIAAMRLAERVGVCVDTCHVFAAGYDIRDPARYAEMRAEAADTVGLARIRCWHFNDSKGECGSCRDRHEHIGHGQIGLAGFRSVLRDERFRGTPMILETPKGHDDRGRAWDSVNAARLRRIAAGLRR